MQATHVAIMPLLLVSVIVLSLLFAVAIVIVSLVKAGKGVGVLIVMITMALGALFLIALLVPVYQVRQQATAPRMQFEEARSSAWDIPRKEDQELTTKRLAPPFVEVAPRPLIVVHPEAPPAPEAMHKLEAAPQPEVANEGDFVGPATETSEAPASAFPAEQAPATPAAAPASTERPAWVDEVAIPTRDIVFRKVINIGKYSTLEEIQSELPQQVDEALRDFMRQSLPQGADSVVTLPPGYAVDHGVLADRWLETHPAAEHSFAEPMYTLHVLTQVDKGTRDDLQARYEASIVEHRVGAVGLGGGLLLALLGTLYGYLKLDTLTQGYYTGRLRLAAGLTGMSAVAGAAALVAERVVMWG